MVAILSKFNVLCHFFHFVIYFLKLKLLLFYNKFVYYYTKIFLILLPFDVPNIGLECSPGLVSFFNGISTLFRLFNAKATLQEEE